MTVAGSAVGSGLGAYVGKSYLGDIDDFSIVKVRGGVKPAVITINGFLSQKTQSLMDWEEVLHTKYRRNAWYHVNWDSQTLLKLGFYILGGGGPAALKKVITDAARKATKAATKRLAPGADVLAIISLATNPWHVAMVNAEKTGVVIADILRRCKGKEFTLLGHSLGARVIYFTLRTLATNAEKHMVRDVHLFGGAVDNDRAWWRHAKHAVGGSIYNYYSNNDQVLKYMYSAGTFFASSPVGRHKIERVKGVRNIDLSSIVDGHMKYKTRIVGEKLR